MLLEKANILSEELKDARKAIVNAFMESGDIMNIDKDSFDALQSFLKIIRTYEEYVVAEAETLLKIESKMDAILMRK